MNPCTVSVNLPAVYHATVTAGHATVIIPDAEAFGACDNTFVTGGDPIVYSACRTDKAAGIIFCCAVPIFWCNDIPVCLHDIFVNETHRLFMLRNTSVNATRVYFNGRGMIACPYYTILYGISLFVNATRVYFSVRSNHYNTTGVYFWGGSEACTISEVFNCGGSVPVKAACVYFSMKHIPDNDAGAFDKGKRKAVKAARVYFTMKSTFGSNPGAAGRVSGNKSCKSGGHIPTTAGIVLHGNGSDSQSAAINRRSAVINCNSDAFVPNADTPGRGMKTGKYLSFTHATAHYTFSGNYIVVGLNDCEKSCSSITKNVNDNE